MKKIIINGLKYLFISIASCFIYAIIDYITNTVIDLNKLIITSLVLFIFLCLLSLIAPFLRKLFGFNNQGNGK